MKVWKYAVTFEYANEAPDCSRGETKAMQPATAAARGIRAAKKEFKGKRPVSMVILLEEVTEEAPSATATD